MKNCDCHSEIPRDGSGQLTRFLTALDPSYAKIDGRSLTDLLNFAKKYAEIIRFYKLQTDDCDEDKTWQKFFSSDFSVLAASVSEFDILATQKNYIEIRDKFDAAKTIENFKELLKPIVEICQTLDAWLNKSNPDFPLHNDIVLAIKSTLHNQVINAFILDKSAMLVNNGVDLGLEFNPKNDTIWDLENANIIIKPELFAGASLPDQLFKASLEVDTIFNACFGVISQIVGKADEYLMFSLEQYPKHQPHMALFIAFLQLFKLAQEQLNGLTEKHLNYYYRDILHLKEKPAQPDQINLIFELAKGVDLFPLEKYAQLSAGKDDLNIEQIYETDSQLVINKAKIKDIKNLFILKNEEEPNKLKFYARPVANSADGFGLALKETDKKWNPFGVDAVKKQSSCGDIINLKATNYAQVGFAIASPQLLLEGGNRKIELRINGLSQLLNNKSEAIKILLSAEKGWLEITKISKDISKYFINNKFSSDFGTEYLLDDNNTLHIFLPIQEKAIVNYDPKIHGEFTFNSSRPVLQILLNNDAEIDSNILEKVSIDNFSLKVIVGSINTNSEQPANFDGVRKLVLQNNEIDIKSETFTPFGVYPTLGNALYIGSGEVFNKQVSELSVNMDWLSRTQYVLDRTFGLSILKNRSFTTLQGDNEGYFSHFSIKNNVLNKNESAFPSQRIENIDVVEKYMSSETDHGFLRMALIEEQPIIIGSFGNDDAPLSFASVNTDTLERRFLNGVDSQSKGVSLSYRSEIVSLDENLDQFFHIYPFGTAEITKNRIKNKRNGLIEETDESGNPIISLPKFSLLPNFKFAQNLERSVNQSVNQYSGSVWQEGNLYIGIEDLVPPQNLSVLFQIAEGTGLDDDKDLSKINWSYLSNNQWKPLPAANIISDTTYGLQTTGIILFDIPKNISTNNTLITNGLHWLAATVDEGSHRMPYLISVVAQAVSATFKNQGNAETHFQKPLAANTISKIVPKPAEVKKVEQPFETFNGVPTEIGKEYWTRVSERLRHKDRAVTVSDYEKLVLEYFPLVFKVKAITHTDPNCLCREPEIKRTRAEEIKKRENGDNIIVTTSKCCGPQVAPGHVLIIPIENLRNRNTINILQPKTSRRIILEIEQFLQKRSSPFVKVHARNPIYEQVLTAFRVQFKSGVDKGYHLTLLNEEIKKYLTPWVYDEFVDITFGAQIYASNVINFIEERPYVDFITDFMLFVIKCDCCKTAKTIPTEEEKNENFEAKDIWQFIRDESEDLEELKTRIDASQPNYDKYEKSLIKEIGNWFETNFNDDFEEPDVVMGTLIEPSSPRSLLVSVENHVIMLYEEDPILTPCEKKTLGYTPKPLQPVGETKIPAVAEKLPIKTADKIKVKKPNK